MVAKKAGLLFISRLKDKDVLDTAVPKLVEIHEKQETDLHQLQCIDTIVYLP